MDTTTPSAETAPAAPAANPLPNVQSNPATVNLGKVKAKDAKKLKKGKAGKLTNKLSQAAGQIQGAPENAVPLYITYEVKPRKKPKKKNKVNFMGLKIDRKKFKSSMKDKGINPTFL